MVERTFEFVFENLLYISFYFILSLPEIFVYDNNKLFNIYSSLFKISFF